jgi:predicted phage-related endonuclease
MMNAPDAKVSDSAKRHSFIGGSDARIIMGDDEAALLRLWREKRGETEPQDYSGDLIVQLGIATEPMNRRWYERTTGQTIKDVQTWVRHPVIRWMAATLDGIVEETGAVFEAKFMLPWSFSEQSAAEKHTAQLQHNMWVTHAATSVLSIVTGGGKWVEIKVSADSLYQHLLLTAEKKFWRCVENGEPPRLFGIEPPRPRIEAVRIVDMSASNAWAEFSAVFRRTHQAHLQHENAKAELKALMPADAKEAIGHGLRAKRSKSGPVSFELLSSKTVRFRDKEHRKFVSRQACLVCGRTPSDPHHLTFTQPRALGHRVSDEFTVPVCRIHHRELHRQGDEAAWWAKVHIDPLPVALRLWQHTRPNGEKAVSSEDIRPSRVTKTMDVSAQGPLNADVDPHPNAESASRARRNKTEQGRSSGTSRPTPYRDC